MPTSMSKAAELEILIGREFPDARFIANVIHMQHSSPVRKLRGLLRLLRRGYSVTLGQFTMDVMLIDGYNHPFTLLERYGHPYKEVNDAPVPDPDRNRK